MTSGAVLPLSWFIVSCHHSASRLWKQAEIRLQGFWNRHRNNVVSNNNNLFYPNYCKTSHTDKKKKYYLLKKTEDKTLLANCANTHDVPWIYLLNKSKITFLKLCQRQPWDLWMLRNTEVGIIMKMFCERRYPGCRFRSSSLICPHPQSHQAAG